MASNYDLLTDDEKLRLELLGPDRVIPVSSPTPSRALAERIQDYGALDHSLGDPAPQGPFVEESDFEDADGMAVADERPPPQDWADNRYPGAKMPPEPVPPPGLPGGSGSAVAPVIVPPRNDTRIADPVSDPEPVPVVVPETGAAPVPLPEIVRPDLEAMPERKPAYDNTWDRVSQGLYAASTRSKLPDSFFSNPAERKDKEAESIERNATLRAAVESRNAKAVAEAKATNEGNDPQSRASQMARDAFMGTASGRKFAEMMGPAFARMPASRLPSFKEVYSLEKQVEGDASKGTRLADSIAGKIGAIEATGEENRETLGMKGGIEADLQNNSQTWKGGENAKDRTSKETIAANSLRASLDRNDRAIKNKADREEGYSNIPGWQHDPKVQIKPGVAEDMREVITGTDAIKKSTGVMLQLMHAHPVAFRSNAWLLNPEIRGPMEVAFSQAKMGVKKFEKLGALVGGDFAIIEEAVNDPNAGGESFRRFIGVSTAREKLKAYGATIDARTLSELAYRGYSRAPAPTPVRAAPASTPPVAPPSGTAPKTFSGIPTAALQNPDGTARAINTDISVKEPDGSIAPVPVAMAAPMPAALKVDANGKVKILPKGSKTAVFVSEKSARALIASAEAEEAS